MKLLWKQLENYKLMTTLVVFFLLVQTGVELFLPTLLAVMIDQGVVNQDLDLIIRTGIFMLLIAALGGLSTVVSSYYAAKIGLGISFSLRKDLFEKVESLSLQEIQSVGTASLITRTTNDVVQIQNFMIVALRMFVRAPIMALGGIFLAVSRDAFLSIILGIVVVVLVLIIVLISRKTSRLYILLQEKTDGLNRILREQLRGIRVIRAFNRTREQAEKFDATNRGLMETGVAVNRLMALMMPAMMLLMSFSTVAILWFGAARVEAEQLLVGNLMAFIQYAMLILFSFIMLTMIFIMYPRAAVSAQRIGEVLELERQVTDSPDARSLEDTIDEISFENVTFQYSSQGEPVLKNISFSARKGEKIGIIGGTGSGKSTLVHLLLRFYDPQEGAVRINGHSLKDLKQEEFRSRMGFVPQESLLFSGTLSENFFMGAGGENQAEMKFLLQQVQLGELEKEEQSAFQMEIMQGGKNLSGGQKQRVTIGRAMARSPQVYIFDDSFSALDYKTDSNIRREIDKIRGDSILLLVAQRVSTLLDADRILVLNKGILEAQGTHEELIKTSPVYQEIVASQMGGGAGNDR